MARWQLGEQGDCVEEVIGVGHGRMVWVQERVW
jgi:hypothetical protein